MGDQPDRPEATQAPWRRWLDELPVIGARARIVLLELLDRVAPKVPPEDPQSVSVAERARMRLELEELQRRLDGLADARSDYYRQRLLHFLTWVDDCGLRDNLDAWARRNAVSPYSSERMDRE